MTRLEDEPSREIELTDRALEELEVRVVGVPVTRGGELGGPAAAADGWLGGSLSRALEEGSFRAEKGKTSLFTAGDRERPHVLAVGLGDVEGMEPDAVRKAAGLTARRARELRASAFGFALPEDRGPPAPEFVAAAAEGAALGDWSFDDLRSENGGEEERPAPPGLAVLHAAEVSEAAREAARDARLVAEAQNYARGLVARPGNVATPRFLADEAARLREAFGLQVEAWGPDRLREEGFGGLLAVAKGSSEEPRFIQLEHVGEGGDPVVFVGKGVTFDSGGISLKPSKGMEDMKYDMAGAAAVLGALRAAAALELPQRVVGLVPSAENLPSGSALKPADVIRGVAGISIEVVNTDAEGRLLLSDALAFAGRLNPRVVVDLATLTGGCVVALGHRAAGLMTDDDELSEALLEAGRRSGERLWRLPIWDAYREQLESDIADIKNSGGREASPLTAGVFLKEFVGEYRWAHLDIAGTAWAEEAGPYQPAGATGTGVRLLMEWLRSTPYPT